MFVKIGDDGDYLNMDQVVGVTTSNGTVIVELAIPHQHTNTVQRKYDGEKGRRIIAACEFLAYQPIKTPNPPAAVEQATPAAETTSEPGTPLDPGSTASTPASGDKDKDPANIKL